MSFRKLREVYGRTPLQSVQYLKCVLSNGRPGLTSWLDGFLAESVCK